VNSGVKVEGARALRRALREAGDDLSDLKDIHFQVAQFVAEVAYGTAPRRSGDLAETIRPNASKTRARVAAGNSKVVYAGPIHWGWPARSRTVARRVRSFGGREWFIQPNPWVVEAAQASENLWVRMYAHRIDQIVDKIGETADGRGL
jgi:hypothetical protein